MVVYGPVANAGEQKRLKTVSGVFALQRLPQVRELPFSAGAYFIGLSEQLLHTNVWATMVYL